MRCVELVFLQTGGVRQLPTHPVTEFRVVTDCMSGCFLDGIPISGTNRPITLLTVIRLIALHLNDDGCQ